MNNDVKFLEYTLTTNIYSADVPMHIPEEVLPVVEEAYLKVISKDKSIITKLLYWVEKYPDIPQFKNYLSTYYSLHGNTEKAAEINNRLLEQFPGYLFARLNIAVFYLAGDKTEKVPAVLGESLELSALYPERKIFHVDEYFSFNETAGIYYSKTQQLDKAEAILDNLYELTDLLDIDKDFENLENNIFISRLQNFDVNKFKKNFKPKNRRTKPTLPQTKKAPAFHYPQISWLYQYSLGEMPQEKIEELLSFDKEWLRIDLETVIYDTIKRYKFFEKKDTDENEIDFCMHAVFLLQEIKAEESLPAILELLRQPEEVLDFWLSDLLTESVWQAVYTIGLNQADKLAEFLKEPMNYTFARTTASLALTQIIFHHPERRAEIISLYRCLIDFFITNKTDEKIIDDTMISLMIGDIIEFNGKELLPDIKKLFNEKLPDESVSENFDKVTDDMNEYEAGGYNEYYKKEINSYFDIIAEQANIEEVDEEEDDFFNNLEEITNEEDNEDDDEFYDDWEDAEEDYKTEYFYSGNKPYVRSVAKVGRNECCSCGSGKKYKNCHGAND